MPVLSGDFKHINMLNSLTPSAKSATGMNMYGTTPYIPKEVYNQLPKLLEEIVKPIKNQGDRERDIILLSSLGVMSAALHNVEGIMRGKPYSPHLNFFIVAPPASGKGVMGYAKLLGEDLHNSMLLNSLNTDKDDNSNGKLKLFFIPGNSSSAAIIRHLNDNSGSAIILESEADTIVTALKQEWGTYSELIRYSFGHEPVSSSRKGAPGSNAHENYVAIAKPMLSIVISGTPGQVTSLIKSAEDGMLSRFGFYVFGNKHKWKNAFDDDVNLDDIYKSLGINISEFNKQYSKPVKFVLTDAQKKAFDFLMRKLMASEEVGSIYGLGAGVARLGIIAFRIAMVLTAVRQYQADKPLKELVCDDIDFNSAMRITQTLFKHTEVITGSFQKMKTDKFLKDKGELLDKLPDVEFTTDKALKIGLNMGMTKRTIERRLKEYVEEGLITKDSRGKYNK